MDSALILRNALEQGCTYSKKEAQQLLSDSTLINTLTSDFQTDRLFAIFRILGLCEIPFAEHLPYTQTLLNYLNQSVATPEGFSYLGRVEEIVPCYNAMLLEAYTRLGLFHSPACQNALLWIKQYQLFDRNQKTTWKHKGICKHGGCLGAVPCYIGIGKTVRALLTYAEYSKQPDTQTQQLIKQGTDYMLRHNMFLRLSSNEPISAHITDIMFPQNYALSATDLVYIVGKQTLFHHPNSKRLLDLIQKKQYRPYQWKIDYLYQYKGYVAFETRRKPSEWISSLFSYWLPKSALQDIDESEV